LKALLVILLVAWLAQEGPKEAPATPALFVVVPGSDGHVGKIVVTPTGGSPRAIDTAYGAQRVNADGTMAAATLTESEVREAFGPTLAALPGKPTTFLLYFLEGKDELTDESRQELDRVFAELKRRPLPDIVVIGHTDTVGAEHSTTASRSHERSACASSWWEWAFRPGASRPRGAASGSCSCRPRKTSRKPATGASRSTFARARSRSAGRIHGSRPIRPSA
jgi:hypothetical protein